MDKTQKMVVVLGIGFAALMLAQAAFRIGTVPMFPSEWNKTAATRDKDQETDAAIKRFGTALGLDWEAVNKLGAADADLFNEAVKNGASEDTPGVWANLGGAEGRPYTWIDGEPYYLSGR